MSEVPVRLAVDSRVLADFRVLAADAVRRFREDAAARAAEQRRLDRRRPWRILGRWLARH